MRTLMFIAAILALALIASGANPPKCGNGAAQACTVTITVTNVSTPIFAAFPSRQYLLIENQGYLNTTGLNP